MGQVDVLTRLPPDFFIPDCLRMVCRWQISLQLWELDVGGRRLSSLLLQPDFLLTGADVCEEGALR